MNPNGTTQNRPFLRALIHLAVLLTALLSRTTGAAAQRTMRGQWYAGGALTCTLSPDAGSHPGVGIEAGCYTMTSRWAATLRASPPGDGSWGSVTTGGVLLYRAAATRSRALSLYCGGGLFLGFDYDDPSAAAGEILSDTGGPTVPDGDSTVQHATFTYGLEPAIEAELFLVRKAALVASLSVPVRLASRQETLSVRASAGLRINF